MKRFSKYLCLALTLACLVACFVCAAPSANAASAGDYDAYRLKDANLLYPSHYYSTVEMTDTPTEHTFIKIASLYPGAAVDNSNKSALCSKPYKFNELYDNWVANGKTGRVVIPCCVINLALDGEPLEIAGAGMTLRSHFDCKPIHMKIQVATDEAATNWVTVYDATNIEWDSISKRWYFDPIKAYQLRFIALDIDDVNIEEEGDYYDPIKGDETRFAYAEVDVFTLKENAGTDTETNTKPTTSTQTPTTRPSIQFPTAGQTTTQPATKAPTTAPTQPATKAPTTVATQPATKAPTTAPTQPATKAPTTVATQPATQVPTTSVETTPVETTPIESTPVETTPVETTPVETVPGEESTVAPTEEPTVAPTVEETQPEATTGTTDNGTGPEDQPKDFTAVIIIAIVVVAAAAGAAVFFIIKKKKNG